MPERGDAPAARAGDLRDQPVDVETVEEAADLGTLLFRVITEMVSELGAGPGAGVAETVVIINGCGSRPGAGPGGQASAGPGGASNLT